MLFRDTLAFPTTPCINSAILTKSTFGCRHQQRYLDTRILLSNVFVCLVLEFQRPCTNILEDFRRCRVFLPISRGLPDSLPHQHNKSLDISYTLSLRLIYNCSDQDQHFCGRMLWWTARPLRSSLSWFRACALTILVSSLGYCLISTQKHARLRRQSARDSHYTTNLDPLSTLDSCPVSGSAQRIVVSVKTGATEAAVKTPTQMQTTLRCIENVLLFSDLEQDIGDYHLHDAL
jgi:hypothetical protein